MSLVPQGLLPRLSQQNPAGTTAFTATQTGTFVTATSQAATLPQSRLLTAGTGITVTDGGAGGAITVATTAPAISGPTTHTMHWNFTDGVIPIADAFTNTWVFYKVGQNVTATCFPTGYVNPSVLTGSVQTRSGSEIPAAFRPQYTVVQPCNVRQGSNAPDVNTMQITSGGVVNPLYLGSTYGAAPLQWPAGGNIDWDIQALTWLAAP